MKTSILLIFIFVGFSHANTAGNKNAKTKATVVKTSAAKVSGRSKSVSNKTSALTTDARFDDQSVGGKYQLPMEALSVVENEKSIDDLIGVRKNFRDRVNRSKGMR